MCVASCFCKGGVKLPIISGTKTAFYSLGSNSESVWQGVKVKTFPGKMLQETRQGKQTTIFSSGTVVENDNVAVGRVLQQIFKTGMGRKP